MAPLPPTRGLFKVLSVLLLLLLSFLSQVHCYSSTEFSTARRILEVDEDNDNEDHHPAAFKIKKKTTPTTSLSPKNKTKILKPSSSASPKNQTKILKSGSGFGSPKNQSKVLKTGFGFGSAKNQTKIKLSSSSLSLKNKTKLLKPISESSKVSQKNQFKKNKTSNAAVQAKEKPKSELEKKELTKIQDSKSQSTKKTTKPYWIDDEQDDLISEFREMPSKFQQTLLPDLERISKTSKVYLNRANKQITNNFKPLVGNKYAPTVASFISFAFIFIPLILVSLIFNRFKAYFSLQKLLIFVQIYLAIYFSILCLSSLVTGLEPLKFFYATSQSTYVCIQLLQTLAYVLYLLMLLMYLVLVFSTDTGPSTRMIGLAQTIVGFAVGLHYYMAVFHRAVLRQPPKTSWRVHALYAACFLLICLLTQAERRKKAYLEEGGEEGKKN
nr:serine-rich adhesin for platelets-like isoform X2 [Ipomoea batatas]